MFSAKQIKISGILLFGLVASVGLIFTSWLNPFFTMEVEADLASRFGVVFKCLLWPTTIYVLFIARTALHRFFTPADSDAAVSPESTQDVAILRAIVQNTHEQLFFAVLTYLSWAALMGDSVGSVIPTASALFVVGRILFFLGYKKGALGRTFGFGMTLYPTATMNLIMVFSIISKMMG